MSAAAKREAGPDPAEVDELAAVLAAAARAEDGTALFPDLARAALKWFAGRQQREGGQP